MPKPPTPSTCSILNSPIVVPGGRASGFSSAIWTIAAAYPTRGGVCSAPLASAPRSPPTRGSFHGLHHLRFRSAVRGTRRGHRRRRRRRHARHRALHRLALQRRPAGRQVRLQPRPPQPLRLPPGRRHGDPRLGRRRAGHEGRRQAPPGHPAAAGLRRTRRGRRDPPQRDADVRRRTARRLMRGGVLAAGAAYVIWGLFPLYFRLLQEVAPVEVLAHRVLWSLALGAVLGRFVAGAALIAVNWGVYLWAVNQGRILEASLGYFITPLANVLTGTLVLHEVLRPLQKAAVVVAAAGVAWLTWATGSAPWIALTLAASFSTYGLLRKTAPLGALEGLSLETLLLAPVAT